MASRKKTTFVESPDQSPSDAAAELALRLNDTRDRVLLVSSNFVSGELVEIELTRERAHQLAVALLHMIGAMEAV